MTKYILVGLLVGFAQIACSRGQMEGYAMEHASSQNEQTESTTQTDGSEDIVDHIQNDQTDQSEQTQEQAQTQYEMSSDLYEMGCLKASSTQMKSVNLGNTKKEEFLALCASKTNNSAWCSQLVRPNPSSSNTFKCTYGSTQVHQLIDPDEATWKYPIEAVRIIQDLQGMGIKVSQIYNWWRPEPYNKNVGGAAGRHPYGTSVDVRFASTTDAGKAWKAMCKMRAQKRIRALGDYGSSSLHIGVGDKTANTWGKTCS